MLMKRLLNPRRMRKSPPRGFGWIDHRLLREAYIGRCSPQALALYLLLACASDAQGLSYYSDPRAAQLLLLEAGALRRARRELMDMGLLAYEKPVYQLLSLEREPVAGGPRRTSVEASGLAAAAGAEPRLAAAMPGPRLREAVESLLQQKGAA